MASFTNIVHPGLCCRPGTISPTLVSGHAKGMEELLPMAYTRSTLQTSLALGTDSDHLMLLSRRNETETRQVNWFQPMSSLRTLDHSFPHFFASIHWIFDSTFDLPRDRKYKRGQLNPSTINSSSKLKIHSNTWGGQSLKPALDWL